MSQGERFLGDMASHQNLGDLTADATVKWVLFKLSSAKDLEEVMSALSEDLCLALDTTRFIDPLREQVYEEANIFQSIECIAEELRRGGWKKYPRLSILLLSIAKKYLIERLENNEARKKQTCTAPGNKYTIISWDSLIPMIVVSLCLKLDFNCGTMNMMGRGVVSLRSFRTCTTRYW